MCTGKYSLINVETILSADLSGIGNASGYPVRWSMIVNIYLFPDVDVSHSVTRSIAILSNGYLEWLSPVKGNVELLLFLFGKVISLQCTS